MIAFLTSSPAVGQDHTRLNPANGLVSELEKVMPRPARGLFVCSDPDDFAFTDRFAGEMFAAFENAGFPVPLRSVLDHRNPEMAAELVKAADLIILAGGPTLAQNRFFQEVHLREAMADFGGVVLGAGLASLYGWTSVEVVSALVIGAVCIAAYVYRQLHMEAPVLDVRVFCQQGYRVGVTLVMLNFGITLSAMYLLPQYIQSGMLLPVAMTGMLMLPGGMVNCIVSVIAGGLYDRIGARIPARVGFALSIAGTVMFLLATPETPIAYVVCAHVILMIGVPLAMSPSQTSALNSLPHSMNADGSTMMNTLQQVLGAVATAVATSLLGMGQAASTEGGAVAFTNGVHWGFTFTLVLAVAALAVSMLLKKRSYAGDDAPAGGAPAHGDALASTPQAESAKAAAKGC